MVLAIASHVPVQQMLRATWKSTDDNWQGNDLWWVFSKEAMNTIAKMIRINICWRVLEINQTCSNLRNIYSGKSPETQKAISVTISFFLFPFTLLSSLAASNTSSPHSWWTPESWQSPAETAGLALLQSHILRELSMCPSQGSLELLKSPLFDLNCSSTSLPSWGICHKQWEITTGGYQRSA